SRRRHRREREEQHGGSDDGQAENRGFVLVSLRNCAFACSSIVHDQAFRRAHMVSALAWLRSRLPNRWRISLQRSQPAVAGAGNPVNIGASTPSLSSSAIRRRSEAASSTSYQLSKSTNLKPA